MITRKTQTMQFNTDEEQVSSYWDTDPQEEAGPVAEASERYPEETAVPEYIDEAQDAVEAPFVYYDNEKHSSSREIMSTGEDREVSADQFDYTELERKAAAEEAAAAAADLTAHEQDQKARDDRQKKRKRKIDWKKRRKRLSPVAIALIVLILIGGFAAARNIISLQVEHYRLVQENKELTAKRDALKIELKNVNSKEYIEQQARRQLRLVNPDEILFVFDNGDEEDAPAKGDKS